MNKLLLTTALLAAIGATPAKATLQLAANIGGDEFFCADNTACDTNPVIGVINTSPVTLDGVTFSSTSAASSSGTLDFLNVSNLLITNTTGAPVTVVIAAGQTGFTPANKFSDADSGTWQGSSASVANLRWFIDAANAQGASNSADTPGVLIDSATSTALFPVLGFSRTNDTIVDALSSPFSMTEQATIVLGAGESLVNRGQAIIGATAVIPETSTWAMMGLGFGLMAWVGFKRKTKRFAF
jgi:hypothetical protein